MTIASPTPNVGELVKFAVNYSPLAAELVRQQRIQVDLFKCPAWPELIASAMGEHPLYVHFPLRVGAGLGDAVDTETKQPADWGAVEKLLAQSQTTFVNLHLAPTAEDFPNADPLDTSPAQITQVTEHLLKDIAAVTQRFGAERVILESIYDRKGLYLRPAFLWEVINQVVRHSGCGLLLDISHARLASLFLGEDARDYIQSLPLDRIREMHVTGIQRFDEHWISRLRRAGFNGQRKHAIEGELLDHLPMTPADWEFFDWVMSQIRAAAWPAPEILCFEYGGIASWWEAITESDVLLEQVPCFFRTIHDCQPGAQPPLH